MSIARTDVQAFFTNLNHNIDSNGVKCFKCDKPLFYKKTGNGLNTKEWYSCSSNHLYTYQDVIFKYALHLENIKDEIANIGACGLQGVDFS